MRETPRNGFYRDRFAARSLAWAAYSKGAPSDPCLLVLACRRNPLP